MTSTKDIGMIQAAYGGGTNSVAMLLGMYERGIKPDLTLFADTGGEKPYTYHHIELMNEWCEKNGFPLIQTIKANGKTLEQDCLDRKALPSIAYGFKTCSQRWKLDVQKSYMKRLKVDYVSWVGIDYDETHRAKEYEGTYYPLIDWRMGRDECVDLIKKHNIPQPLKSACFFCPSSKASEVVMLGEMYPELIDRALAMESNAELEVISGLGRNWSWSQMMKQSQLFPMKKEDLDRMFPIFQQKPCGCMDGASA